MEKKEYLNEEEYQKTKNKISVIGKIVTTTLWLIAITLIGIGIFNVIKYNNKEVLKEEETKLVKKQEELENKIKPIEDEIKKLERVEYNGRNEEYYARVDKIEELKESLEDEYKQIYIIESVLEDGSSRCNFEDYRENELTSKYCDYKEIRDIRYIPFFIGGFFTLFVAGMASLMFVMITKRREIMSYQMQDVRPIAEEGIEKMAPSAGKVAKEVAKGIKKGLDEE